MEQESKQKAIKLLDEIARDQKLASQMDYVKKMSELVEWVAELTEMVERAESVRRAKDYIVTSETNRYVPPPPIVPERFRSITEPLDYSLVPEDFRSITTLRYNP